MMAITEWALVNDDGEPILDYTSMISVEIKQEGRVSSEPIEEGGFASYNKVEFPLDARVQVGMQGEPDELQDFLDKLVELKKEAETFSLVTAEQEHKNLTLESYDYARKREDGINTIFAELRIVEIREVSPQFANVKLPPARCRNKENASRVDTGRTQAEEAPYNSMFYRALG